VYYLGWFFLNNLIFYIFLLGWLIFVIKYWILRHILLLFLLSLSLITSTHSVFGVMGSAFVLFCNLFTEFVNNFVQVLSISFQFILILACRLNMFVNMGLGLLNLGRNQFLGFGFFFFFFHKFSEHAHIFILIFLEVEPILVTQSQLKQVVVKSFLINAYLDSSFIETNAVILCLVYCVLFTPGFNFLNYFLNHTLFSTCA